MKTAARFTCSFVVVALLLRLTSPTLGGTPAAIGRSPTFCTTREDPLLHRLETACDDGTWAIWPSAKKRVKFPLADF